MTRRPELPDTVEHARIERVYGDYGSSTRRRRAWSSDNPANASIRSELTAALLDAARPALDGDGDVLDVGCGGGWWLRALADAGVAPRRLHGVDLLDDRLAAAARAVPEAQLTAADARRLPYDDDSFGLVTLLVTLSSLPDARAVVQALTEVRRVARTRARVLIYEPRYPNPLNRHTLLVRSNLVDPVLGAPVESIRLTVAPPLLRPLGGVGARVYPLLRSIGPLRTHALRVHEVS